MEVMRKFPTLQAAQSAYPQAFAQIRPFFQKHAKEELAHAAEHPKAHDATYITSMKKMLIAPDPWRELNGVEFEYFEIRMDEGDLALAIFNTGGYHMPEGVIVWVKDFILADPDSAFYGMEEISHDEADRFFEMLRAAS